MAEKGDEANRLLKGAKEKGYLEAQRIVRLAQRQVSELLEEARREKKEAVRGKLAEKATELEVAIARLQPEEDPPPAIIAIGQVFFVKPLNCDATVLSVDRAGGRARVRAGSMELEVKLPALSKARGKEQKIQKKRQQLEVAREPAAEINLLGMRVDEALDLLEPFLYHADLDQVAELRVVHGHGTGALLKGVRAHLSGHPVVASFRGGERFEGGDGVTMVTLR
jgi:DNA mismatch repair protein MutS2